MNGRARLAGCAALAALGVTPLAAVAGLAPELERSQLVIARVAGMPPDLILAQRVVEREWGRSEDSVYVEREIAGWRSEPGAMLLSAAVPGAGQYYAGEKLRGMMFALAEAVGWTARIFLRSTGDAARDDAAAFVGAPQDSASTWSFERWADATQQDAAELQRLYAADPEAFYDLIATDAQLLAGWNGGGESREHFIVLRHKSDRRLRGARFAESVLWVNHVAAALDALRAARLNNIPLAPSLGLDVRGGWRRGRPELMATIVRRF